MNDIKQAVLTVLNDDGSITWLGLCVGLLVILIIINRFAAKCSKRDYTEGCCLDPQLKRCKDRWNDE